MAMNIMLPLPIFFAGVVTMAIAVGATLDEVGCERTCGNISVPYPFGLGDAEICSRNPNYKLICNNTFNPPRLFLGENLPLFNIFIENATAIVGIDMSYTCYNKSGVSQGAAQNATLGASPFLFSTLNKFFGIGCDTIALIGDWYLERFTSGCSSVCSSNNIRGLENPFNFTQELISCGGIGCCQTSVPNQLGTLYIELSSYKNHSTQLDTNPCSFGFLADPAWYRDVSNFTLADLPEKQKSSRVVLDWAIRENRTSEEDKGICGGNTSATNSTNGPGYFCSCLEGFEGNPYTEKGCQDIDECSVAEKNPCSGRCINIPGSFTCSCPFGKQHVGKLGCSLSTASKVVIGIVSGSFLVSIFCFHVLVPQKEAPGNEPSKKWRLVGR